MKITEKYGIKGPVPFVDVHVERDNLLFVDPSAIRNDRRNPRAARAQRRLLSFFSEVLRCVASTAPADRAKGIAMVSAFHEPNETRLGMSTRGLRGHGISDGMGFELWTSLSNNAACQEAALQRLEDLPLFVEGIDKDLVSDLTTRVIYAELAEFTGEMMLTYPALGATPVSVDVQTYNPRLKDWSVSTFSLPNEPQHPLLLVPKHWIYWRLLMAPRPFYNRHSTRTVQDETAYVDTSGRVVRRSKAAIKHEHRDPKALNSKQAAKYQRGGTDLVAIYRAEVDDEFEPLSDAEITRRTE